MKKARKPSRIRKQQLKDLPMTECICGASNYEVEKVFGCWSCGRELTPTVIVAPTPVEDTCTFSPYNHNHVPNGDCGLPCHEVGIKHSTPTQETEERDIEGVIENIMAESSREPDGERLWIKTSYELADLIRPIIKEALTQREEAVRERIKKSVMEIVIKESKLGCVCDYKLASYFASLTPQKEENL